MSDKGDVANLDGDTIAALATAPGRGAVAVVRISGLAVPQLANKLLGKLPPPRLATLAHVRDAQGLSLDEVLALYFPAPKSYTGEHVLELHGHGGHFVPQLVLDAVLAAGARPAEPGEFSQRAFLSGKLDLNQAEAVADLIDAGSRQAASAALRSLRGGFSDRLNELSDVLIDIRVWVEAAIDFSDEDIDFLADEALTSKISHWRDLLQQTILASRRGEALRDGLHLVIGGFPNAGKSSLLNRLAERDVAIVTDIPGTTRDVVSSSVLVGGITVHLSDTAGIRETQDAIEKEGVRRSKQVAREANHVLWIHDDNSEVASYSDDPFGLGDHAPPTTWVLNKTDVSGRTAGKISAKPYVFSVSAKTGQGIEELLEHLAALAGSEWSDSDSVWLARERHVQALAEAKEHFETGVKALQLEAAGEIFAEELRLAQQALAPACGKMSSDELLGEIFGRFCVGK